MCSKKGHRSRSTVAFRLTVIFFVLFALLLGAVLIPIDLTLHSIMIHQLDAKIAAHLGNFSYYGGLFDRKSRDEAIGRIVAECDRLIGIVNTMLEMAAMDAGTTELPETPVDVTAIVREACELFRPLAEDKTIALHWSLNGSPATVRGSKENLQRVVSNILDNAIKFTPEAGRIQVEVAHAEAEISVRVQDTGVGISQENQSRIFDRFFRADSSRSANGNGLGLSLAQSIVKAHGGRIQVESEEGRGSRFTVVLPRLLGDGRLD